MRRLLLLLLIACDSGHHRTLFFDAPESDGADGLSGVSRDKRLAAISAAEMMRFCEWLIPLQGPERTITCADNSTTTTGTTSTVSTCVMEGTDFQTMYPACEATVGQYEDCLADLAMRTDLQVCDNVIPPSCNSVINPSPNCGGM